MTPWHRKGDSMTNELADLLPWLDGYVVGQVRSYGDDFEGVGPRNIESFAVQNLQQIDRSTEINVMPGQS